MTPTYQALELAASSLIDAVNDCANGHDEEARLMEAVADTCEALGDRGAAHKARHRLADHFVDAVALFDEHGGVDDLISIGDASERVGEIATDVRALTLPWYDRHDVAETCEDVAEILDSLADAIAETATSDPDETLPAETLTSDERDRALDACKTAAEIVCKAGEHASHGAALARLAEEIEDLDAGDGATPAAILGRLALTLDDQAHITASDVVITAARRVGKAGDLDAMADRIVSTHEAGEPWSEILAAVAVTLREAGRHDAANLLTRP